MSGEGVIPAVPVYATSAKRIATPVFACARPRANGIALFVDGGAFEMTRDEAEALHAAIGGALQLLANPGELPQ